MENKEKANIIRVRNLSLSFLTDHNLFSVSAAVTSSWPFGFMKHLVTGPLIFGETPEQFVVVTSSTAQVAVAASSLPNGYFQLRCLLC